MVTSPLESLSLDQLRNRTSMKWREYPPDVLPLWVAEMDAAPAEPIVRAVHDAMARGDTGYPAGHSYAEALADFADDQWGWRPEIASTAIVADVMVGVVEMLNLVTEPGDAVIVNPPVYPPFFAFVRHARRRIVEAPLAEDGRLDLAAIELAMREAREDGRSAAYLLCNPHNPTGTVHTPQELATVAQLADRHGVRVIVDEIHAPLALAGATHTPYLSVAGTDNAFSLMSASKGWNLAGLKAGLAMAGTSSAPELAAMPEIVSHGPSHLGVIAQTAAFREGRDWLSDLRAGLDHNRARVSELLANQLPGIVYRPGQATYLGWLDCRAVGLGDDPAAAFLERGRVALNSGLPFGTGGSGHVRLNLATSEAILTEAVRRMAASLD